MLSEEVSAVLQRKLPPKLKDPGSFTIPCTIGEKNFEKVLLDLGASVNLMPYSVYKTLGVGPLQNINISLQFADRSVKYPRGIVEDVLVKVADFILPADFIVLDMEDTEIRGKALPLIMGRPFMATADRYDCFSVDMVQHLVKQSFIETSRGGSSHRLGRAQALPDFLGPKKKLGIYICFFFFVPVISFQALQATAATCRLADLDSPPATPLVVSVTPWTVVPHHSSLPSSDF
ncbi:hypothetical protein RchiOBHm_Chr1g0381281 [Rosa chinensis]|uniref:Aspartic peptidase domain-containing protein n=1 Tax=Rosa chinensis TaxID=74649 RepID=A0A2P6SP39_ROSCH|nr:hypothetical protein RchiOBHm_Chr1g0381281 [Rosa chinensis]